MNYRYYLFDRLSLILRAIDGVTHIYFFLCVSWLVMRFVPSRVTIWLEQSGYGVLDLIFYCSIACVWLLLRFAASLSNRIFFLLYLALLVLLGSLPMPLMY